MKLIGKIGIGMVALTCVLVLDGFIGYAIGYQADVKACKTLTRAEVIDAVVADVTHPDKRIFNQFHLVPSNLYVDREAIQIGPTSVLAPLRISSEPDRQYFAMLRCSDLEDIEYASD
ncbi:hypothetical protein CYR55_18580 [Chimaeribacter californicus]|uniref:Uncharacterized protein n=1 Tax=Chimaeribacter californicus TaxID=2060067 RepID=A0A2N5DYE3_9GAMM|nr:hypothetical protein [Chimaeribacter californicus]PLR32587.1 hypothetical protein CYR55_18580 [Chimaeribacter californicus]